MCRIQGLWQSRWGSLLNIGLAGRMLTTFQKGDPLSSFILRRLSQLMQAGWSQHPWEKDLGSGSCHHGPPGTGSLSPEGGPLPEPQGDESIRARGPRLMLSAPNSESWEP